VLAEVGGVLINQLNVIAVELTTSLDDQNRLSLAMLIQILNPQNILQIRVMALAKELQKSEDYQDLDLHPLSLLNIQLMFIIILFLLIIIQTTLKLHLSLLLLLLKHHPLKKERVLYFHVVKQQLLVLSDHLIDPIQEQIGRVLSKDFIKLVLDFFVTTQKQCNT